MSNQIQHHAHRKHPLVLRDTGSSFLCDGCSCFGVGSHYRCDLCDFDLHEFCATCPPATTFAFHGQHPLTFQPAGFLDGSVTCSMCEDTVKGMNYSCWGCNVCVHPICSQLSPTAPSPMHTAHTFVLAVDAPVPCTLCGTSCYGRYQCVPCNINLHPRCLIGTRVDTLRDTTGRAFDESITPTLLPTWPGHYAGAYAMARMGRSLADLA
ncbi:hypothetical protein QYE76_043844 [Lolium multiflorum]|uniref:Phorbol-ester/DAG-type domain-containing protein n=1 Tax=Lolium multiflorum TaxID=4521 RepID=A0AAD8WYA0_LOLMU|nr:hypothetical protein QYE76_043844 [Lolium multiflorum]